MTPSDAGREPTDGQRVKGAALRARLDFVAERAGEDGVRRVLDALPPDDRRTIRSALSALWYPFALAQRLDAAIVETVGRGSLDFFERLGEASAERNLSTVHRSYLVPGNPHGFLEKAPQVYRSYYEAGWREYARTGAKEGVITTHDAPNPTAADCRTVVGWYRKALEMCGARGVRVVEEECRANGGAVCRYRVSWT